MKNDKIDGGKAFDWGKVSADYAKYRDIYPDLFYQKIIKRGLCTAGQAVLDLGTGTGVLPRNMAQYGASWIGIDSSANQIEAAKKLSAEQKVNAEFFLMPAERLHFPPSSFDVITACQCFWYFDTKVISPLLADLLKDDGTLLVLCMEWLPMEDEIAGKSEELVLKFSPSWSGAREQMHPISIDNEVLRYFEPVYHKEYLLDVPFTKEQWHGRMKACRGVGASLSPCELAEWEQEHLKLLDEIAPEQFRVKHYAAMAELKPRR